MGTIHFGVSQSPFGLLAVGFSDQKVSDLFFVEKDSLVLKTLRANHPESRFVRDDKLAKRQVQKILKDTISRETLVLGSRGTDFERKVWRALQRIPRGQTMSYGSLARSIGHPRASRAVGRACGRNPIAILIPCHRVVTADGRLGGYRWGVARKKKLLSAEGVNFSF